MRHLLLTLTLLLTPTIRAAETPKSVVLVELFTSEGCSSCPPADTLLPTLTARNRLVLTLSEHVTYWNYLGWQDPFSADQWTQRQQAYAGRMRSSDTYTPQVVINGTAQALGSDPRAIQRAIADQPITDATLTIQSLAATPTHLTLTWLASALPPGTQLFAVIADDRASTQVQRGENGGRTLTHVNVARTLTNLGTAATGTTTLVIPPILPGQPPARHLILFAQSPNHGQILTATTHPL